MSDIYHYTGIVTFWAVSSVVMAVVSTWMQRNYLLFLPRAMAARSLRGRLHGMNLSIMLPHLISLSHAWESQVDGFHWRTDATRRRQSEVMMTAISTHPSLLKQVKS